MGDVQLDPEGHEEHPEPNFKDEEHIEADSLIEENEGQDQENQDE